MDLSFIPSPSRGVLYLGPVPLRGYAFCIIIGVFVAVWLGGRRWVARGGKPGTVADIAVWAVPFGLVGGRLYHVITDYELYFKPGRDWVDAFKVWEGGLGIWGAIALGAVGAWIGCRRRGIALPAYADAIAPGIVFAQAIGRWGNWFNQELYGRPTDVPWALKITSSADGKVPGLYHPTFLYESLWCVAVGFAVIWADRRFKLGHGQAFAVYVAAYCVGRGWIEYLRVDEAHHILGLRLNDFTALGVFLLAVLYLVLSRRMHPTREAVVEPDRPGDSPSLEKTASADTAGSDTAASADADATPSSTDADAKAPADADTAASADAGATPAADAETTPVDADSKAPADADTAASTDADAKAPADADANGPSDATAAADATASAADAEAPADTDATAPAKAGTTAPADTSR